MRKSNILRVYSIVYGIWRATSADCSGNVGQLWSMDPVDIWSERRISLCDCFSLKA